MPTFYHGRMKKPPVWRGTDPLDLHHHFVVLLLPRSQHARDEMPQLSGSADAAVESRDAGAAAGQSCRWRGRIVRGVVLLLLLLSVCLAVVGYQHQRKQQMIAVVRAAGGFVRDDRTLLSRIRFWYEHGQIVPYRVEVNLEKVGSDPTWLRENNWLSGLGIHMLDSIEGKVAGADLARLIDAHPLTNLDLQGTVFTDEIAAAVGRKSDLEWLSLVQCELTDEQFTRLPLEHVRTLALSGATVSPAGLQSLERCEKLANIGLDARQLTPQTAELLSSLGTVQQIWLSGDVNDDHLLLLRSIKSLYRIELGGPFSATREGIAELKLAMPDCMITP